MCPWSCSIALLRSPPSGLGSHGVLCKALQVDDVKASVPTSGCCLLAYGAATRVEAAALVASYAATAAAAYGVLLA